MIYNLRCITLHLHLHQLELVHVHASEQAVPQTLMHLQEHCLAPAAALPVADAERLLQPFAFGECQPALC